MRNEENFCQYCTRQPVITTLSLSASWNQVLQELSYLLIVCVFVFIPFHRRGFSWLKQNNECNARDQASDVVLRKSLCVKYIHHHIIDNHSRDLQASNCARVSVKPGGATRSKRQLLILSKTQLLMLSKSAKHSYLPPH